MKWTIEGRLYLRINENNSSKNDKCSAKEWKHIFMVCWLIQMIFIVEIDNIWIFTVWLILNSKRRLEPNVSRRIRIYFSSRNVSHMIQINSSVKASLLFYDIWKQLTGAGLDNLITRSIKASQKYQSRPLLFRRILLFARSTIFPVFIVLQYLSWPVCYRSQSEEVSRNFKICSL